jgi:glutathione S-transferase
MRKGLRFNALPVLDIDGKAVTQSSAICRYIGKKAGLYPTDDLQALYCDEVMDAVEDLSHHISTTFGLQGEELRLAREKLAEGWLSIFLRGLDELLSRGGGEYFAANGLTVADLKACYVIRWLRSGSLDHIPVEIVELAAPGLVRHQQRVESDPRVVAYYAARS